MVKYVILILILILPACKSWSRGDTIREIAVSSTYMVDMAQTRYIVNNPYIWEANPIIGEDGENIPPEIYFPVCAALSFGVSVILPKEYREAWQYMSIGVEAGAIVHNEEVFNR